MPRARRKDLVLGKSFLPWSRSQPAEAGKGPVAESRTVNAGDVCLLGRRNVALLRRAVRTKGPGRNQKRRETRSVAKRNRSRARRDGAPRRAQRCFRHRREGKGVGGSGSNGSGSGGLMMVDWAEGGSLW